MNPNIKLVIGLVGKKSSGKDTSMEFLREAIMQYTKLQVYRQSFADELKKEVAALFGGSVEAINRNKSHPLVRQALQNHGSFRREESNNMCWIEEAAKLLPLYDCPCAVVFTDVRYENEAAWIKKELSGILVRIYRTETDDIKDDHESETALSKIFCDYSINNDWTLLRLKYMCKDLVSTWKNNGIL